jgi:hypothetical protein
MLVDRRLAADIGFIVEYFDISKVEWHIHLGYSHDFTRAYTYHLDIEHSIVEAFTKYDLLNDPAKTKRY